MKSIIADLNKAFDSRIRLGIMSVLMVNESVDFLSLRQLLDVTDGNLASHIKALEGMKMIEVRKQFIGRKPNTTYLATELGRMEFKQHLSQLEKIIKDSG